MAPPPASLRLAALLVGLTVLCAYLLSAGPTFYWLDSGELVAAAWGLGVAHAPGHPIASLLGRLFCLLPVGTLAFRVSLGCAVQAAAAAALLVLLSGRLLGQLPLLPPSLRAACAAVAGLLAGLSYAVWFQAVRAEVYALNLLLLIAIAHELLAWEQDQDRRRLLCAALLTGLALCNHHLLVLLALPVLLLFVLLRHGQPGRRRLLPLVLAAGLLGLVPLAYLPLRAQRLPEVNWGAPRTLSRFVWTVSARSFQQSVERAQHQSLAARAGGAGFALLSGLGPIAALLAAGGLYLLWRRRQTRRAALLLTGLTATNLLSPILVGFDPFNPDAHGYLAVAVAALAPGLAVLLAALLLALQTALPRHTRLARTALLGAAAVLPLQQALHTAPLASLRGHWDAEETGRAQLDGPPGALLLTSYFGTIFNLWALRVTSDLRPDLEILHRHFLDQPGYLEDLELRAARATRAGQAGPQAAALPRQARAWEGIPGPRDLEAVAAGRPLLVELDLDLPSALEDRLGPAGLLPRLGGARDAPAVATHLRHVAAWRAALAWPAESETRRALVWHHYQLARHGCRQQLTLLARAHLAAAAALAPADLRLGQLAASCPRASSPR